MESSVRENLFALQEGEQPLLQDVEDCCEEES